MFRESPILTPILLLPPHEDRRVERVCCPHLLLSNVRLASCKRSRGADNMAENHLMPACTTERTHSCVQPCPVFLLSIWRKPVESLQHVCGSSYSKPRGKPTRSVVIHPHFSWFLTCFYWSHLWLLCSDKNETFHFSLFSWEKFVTLEIQFPSLSFDKSSILLRKVVLLKNVCLFWLVRMGVIFSCFLHLKKKQNSLDYLLLLF